MLILHTADWHFAARQYGMAEREADYYAVGRHIAHRAVHLKADIVILAGDMFDMPRPHGVAVNEMKQIVRMMTENKILVVGVDGNHDYTGGEWLKVCGIVPLSSTPLGYKGIKLAGINYSRANVIHETLKTMVEKGQQADIMVLHQPLAEVAGFDTADLSGMDMVENLTKLGVKYVALGDIHDYREFVLGGIRFVYPSSPEMTAMDQKPDKSFSLIKYTGDLITTTIFEPVPCRPFQSIQLNTEQDLDGLLKYMEANRRALVVIGFEPEKQDLANRAETILQNKGMLYRMIPLKSGATIDITALAAKEGVERRTAISRLKESISKFFEETSEQYQLVLQLLSSPDNVDVIIKQYLESKTN